MAWIVEIGDEFDVEFDKLADDVQTEILHWRGSFSNLDRSWVDRALTP